MPLPMLRQLTLASLITLGLTACGGSDSGPNPPAASSSAGQPSSSVASSSSVGQSSSAAASSSSAPADVEPAEFSFEPQTGVERGATVTSNAITVSEIDAATTIGIAGGAYAVNGGDYTQGEGTVESGDSVTVQLTAPEGFATEASVTLTIGGVSGTFTVTTQERDTTPDTFSFAPLNDQEPEAEVTSGTVTITGINDAATISVENGLYAIDGGDFTAEAGEVQENQSIALQTTVPAGAGATREVTLTVGGVAGVWTVSTPEDTEPPEAEFVFPTPMTATEADTVIVRGTATDTLSTVTRVTLQVTNDNGTNDLDLESEDDFATWQKTVTLADGDNTITLTAEDEFGNVLSDGGSVTVVRQAIEKSFPDADLPIEGPLKLVYDEERERVLFGGITNTVIYSVDINTGKRSAFFTQDMAPELDIIEHAEGLEITPGGGELLVLLDRLKSEGPGVLRIDLDTKEYEVLLTRDSQPEDQPKVTRPTSLRLDPTNSDRAFMLDEGMDSMVSLDLTSGVRTLVSNDDFSGPVMDTPDDLLINADNDRALVVDAHETLYWVDLASGDRTLLFSEGTPNDTPRFYLSSAIATDNIEQRVLGVDWISHALWSIDTETGAYEVISGPSLPHAYNELINFTGMDLSNDNEYLIGVDANQEGLFVIDIKTGERVILSKN
ncbi:hypothetical protein [Marinimicrobium agarilyticum]|uniref:hypothetical protein n=1 Tax=Marinimicrobium agarilyticum TaxID=306546 RepID=UPI0003FC4152|nr:hypothetical protein [Marinimicrobium agarilyticum]